MPRRQLETALMATPPPQARLLLPTLLILASGIGILAMLNQLCGLLYSLVILIALAIVFTYILLIPVEWVERTLLSLSTRLKGSFLMKSISPMASPIHARAIAVVTVFLFFFIAFSTLFVLIAPRLTHQVSEFANDLPGYLSKGEMKIIEWGDDTLGDGALKKIFAKDIEKARQAGTVAPENPQNTAITDAEKQAILSSVFSKTVTQIVQMLDRVVETTFENAIGIVTHTLNGFIYFISGLVLLFYFLLDGDKIKAGLIEVVPEPAKTTLNYFLTNMHRVMFNFVKGQVVLAIVSGCFMFILYSLFHVKYAIFLSAFFTVAEILPVIGPWIAFTPGILVVLFSEHPEHALYIWFIYVLIKDNFILPKVVGEVMGLHPVVVILAILVCAKIGGVMGVVLALPIASILTVMLGYVFHPQNEVLPLKAGDL